MKTLASQARRRNEPTVAGMDQQRMDEMEVLLSKSLAVNAEPA